MMSETKCIHCGTDCGSAPLMMGDRPFCCQGCKAVYQLLEGKNMGQYYQIQPMSGIKMGEIRPLGQFAFLDIDEIRLKLLTFHDGETSRATLFLPGIHCASCIWLLEHLNTLHPGIVHSTVDFPKKEVHITFKNDQISLRQIAELLTSIHYIPEINLSSMDEKKKPSSNRSLIVKIGIAAFSFLNIMMYSFPEYLPGGDMLEQEFKNIFGWLSFVLILPVVSYCASDYYLSAWRGLKHNVISIDIPITLGIIALFLHSSWDVFNGNGIGYMDSLAGLLFFLLIGKWYQGKTYQALSFERDYKSYFPVAVTRLGVDGSEQIIPIRQVKKDDVILVRNQELIPADAILIRGGGNIDYSFVTGESIPVPRQTGELIYAGGRQVGSAIELKVEKEVEQSYLTRLWNQKSEKQDNSRLDAMINRVSRWFTLAVILLAFAGLFFWWYVSGLATAVFVFSSVLIIACPCALALTGPFTLGSTMRVFGRRGFYIKNTHVIEQLHRTGTIVFDKTGTITQSRSMQINYHGDALTSEDKVLIRSLVRHSSHPLSAALNDYLGDAKQITPEGFQEVPGLGITGQVKWQRVNIGNRLFVEGIPDDSTSIGSKVYISIAGDVKGYFSIENQYREGFDQVSKSLNSAFDLHLLSGDNDAERNNLEKLLGKEATMLFNQSPVQKREYVVNLKDQGKKVLMIGDGLNDAGALAESHAGITVADDAFSFSPACDAILEAAQFKHLHRFIAFTHTSFRVIRASFAISFAYNVIGLSFALGGALSPLVAAILMPISSISVVAFATFSINYMGRRELKY